MKARQAFLSTILTIVLTLPMFGQHSHDDNSRKDMKHHDMSGMSKPTVDATFDGLHLKVWIMTQKDHKEMKGMNHDGMEMDKATRESMMEGTHHIMIDINDATSAKEIATTDAKVLIVSPSQKSSSVNLKPMMSHFGRGLTLDEKGEYEFTVSVNVNGVVKTKHFQYAVI